MIYECAGIVGVNPDTYSLRHLTWMADAVRRDRWDRTATVLAMLFNINRNPKERAKGMEDFHPYEHKPKKRGVPLTDIKQLKNLLPKGCKTSRLPDDHPARKGKKGTHP